MKFTQYFLYTRQRLDRAGIELSWIERVIATPIREELQADGRVRLWAPIAEADHRYLRVVLLGDRVTVHNAFYDRGFKP